MNIKHIIILIIDLELKEIEKKLFIHINKKILIKDFYIKKEHNNIKFF